MMTREERQTVEEKIVQIYGIAMDNQSIAIMLHDDYQFFHVWHRYVDCRTVIEDLDFAKSEGKMELEDIIDEVLDFMEFKAESLFVQHSVDTLLTRINFADVEIVDAIVQNHDVLINAFDRSFVYLCRVNTNLDIVTSDVIDSNDDNRRRKVNAFMGY